MTADLQALLKAKSPLTLTGVPTGFLPWLSADLARLAGVGGRAVLIAADEAAMRAIGDAAAFFAPELDLLTFPAWDCLPYDRSSPSLRATSERLATLHALQRKPDRPQLLVTTINAALQRTLTPFRVRQLVATLKPGERIDMNRLASLLQANGYARTETVHDAGEFAVRGGIVDLFPAGQEEGLRLDFFGDEIETVRRFDPGSQRTTGTTEGFTLLPASETLLDEDSVKRFRSRYRELFGANATGDPLYQAVSDGRRIAGVDHWLPLFEERLATLFDHLGESDIIVREAGVTGAAGRAVRSGRGLFRQSLARPVERPRQLPAAQARHALPSREEWEQAVTARRIHLATTFHEPGSAAVMDFEVEPARDFAPNARRTSHLRGGDRPCRRPAAGQAQGRAGELFARARERLRGLLADHGLKKLELVDSWQEALGSRDRAGGGSARPRLFHPRRGGAHRAGHAGRPAGPPPQAQEEPGRLPQRARHPHPGRFGGARRSRHRPL
jgi:transcription-repair coupling factor (superfamily II helicase)